MDVNQIDFNQLYHFLFETFEGVGVLVVVGLVLSILISAILERKTRKRFTNHEKTEDDWSFFDDEEEEESR